MSLYARIISYEEASSIIGLGYVEMPIAAVFTKKVNVLGLDINFEKIDLYKSGIDNNEVVSE